ncbi:hypothetical protein BYT27DRAFT_7340928 [Phlegmacium glaucopus]|nr:hypothetical protein BYT27DRAFT_7340928 [Phlegmacium glaucopus]
MAAFPDTSCDNPEFFQEHNIIINYQLDPYLHVNLAVAILEDDLKLTSLSAAPAESLFCTHAPLRAAPAALLANASPANANADRYE